MCCFAHFNRFCFCSHVKNITALAFLRCIPRSAKTLRTVLAETMGVTDLPISARGFQWSLLASLVMLHQTRLVALVGCLDPGWWWVEPVSWNFSARFFTVVSLMSFSLAAQLTFKPACRAPINWFLQGESRCLHWRHSKFSPPDKI